MVVAKEDPLARKDGVTVHDVGSEHVIIRSGAQLATRDIDEPGMRLEDLLGDRTFVGSNNLAEMIQMVKAGCGVAFALMPLDMDSGDVAHVPLV